jgi:hypothetical protein
MLKNRHRHRVTAWIAFFAILMASLMPAISSAFTTPQGASFAADICTIGSTGYKAPDTVTPRDASSKAGLHLEHCPFCLTHAGSFGLPPTSSIAMPVPVLPVLHAPVPGVPSLLLAAPWSTPRSRAPPAAAFLR